MCVCVCVCVCACIICGACVCTYNVCLSVLWFHYTLVQARICVDIIITRVQLCIHNYTTNLYMSMCAFGVCMYVCVWSYACARSAPVYTCKYVPVCTSKRVHIHIIKSHTSIFKIII